MRLQQSFSVFAFALLAAGLCCAQQASLKWTFDDATDDTLKTTLANSGDELAGSWRLVPGVKGRALEFDGYTTELSRPGKQVPELGNAFTVSAWVALDYYPWNWIPVIDQSEFQQVG